MKRHAGIASQIRISPFGCWRSGEMSELQAVATGAAFCGFPLVAFCHMRLGLQARVLGTLLVLRRTALYLHWLRKSEKGD